MGHRCGVIPYSSVWWWIASRARDELVQWMNSLRRRGVLELDELVCMRVIRMIRPLLWWWLVLFIEALVLFPNVGGKGSHNANFEGRQLVQAILTKVVFACQRL